MMREVPRFDGRLRRGVWVAIVALGWPQAAIARAPQEAAAPDQGALWRDAQAKLETADYAGAIASLTTLYERVVHDPEAGALRNRVRISLQEAHVGAYAIDADPQHLVAALDLLDRTLESLPEAEQARRSTLTTRREQVQAMLDAHEEPTPVPEPEPIVEPVPEPAPAFEPEPLPEPEPIAQPVLTPDPDAGRPLIIAGATLLGVGLIGNGLLIGGLVSANSAVQTFETEPRQRADARRDVTRGNTIGIIGGAVGGAFTVTGAVLLTLGIRRRNTKVVPMIDARTMGASWSGRF